MSEQVIPDGTYTVMGPGGQLTMLGPGSGVVLLEPQGGPTQQWALASGPDGYTLRNAQTSLYLGNDGDPDQPSWQVKGTSQPVAWRFSAGADGDPSTYVLAPSAAGDSLALTMSILRIYPPQLAIQPPSSFGLTAEWTFRSA